DFYPQENEERDLHYLKFPSPPKKSVLPLFFKDENFLFKYSPQFIPIEKIVEMENEMVEYPVKREEERELLLESVFSPNSLPALLKLVREAEETIFMEYMYFDPSWNDTEHMNPLLSELVNASMRGVDIKIILDSMPSYNSELVEVLSSLSCSNISLAYFNNGFFNTLHNKAMLIDSKTVLISSINLNHNSIMRNLEAGIIIRNRDVTTFYKNLFEFDWKLSLPILNGEEMNKESHSPPPIFVKIYPNPYVKNDLNEFFVIYNPGEAKLNLSGWYLTDLEHIVTFPLNSFINPKEEILICRDPLSLVQETHYTPDFYYHFDEKIKGNWVRMLFSPLFIGLNRARGFT
ncbi:MAG TPA: hypothetical protein EYP29_00210, partial [Thermoplasmata archaeon]|nr:hypothetical protein [Thermoplasmata archaeon]